MNIKFRSAFLLDLEDLPDADDHFFPESVMKIHIDEKNRNLQLNLDKSEVFDAATKEAVLQSRVESKRVMRYYRLEDMVKVI